MRAQETEVYAYATIPSLVAPLDMLTPILAHESVLSDGSADTEPPTSETYAYFQESSQELISLMKQLLTQQVAANEHLLTQQATTNNLLAALMQHKNFLTPVGPVAASPAPSEASDDASSLSYKTAPRPFPSWLPGSQSETGPQPELIPPPATSGNPRLV